MGIKVIGDTGGARLRKIITFGLVVIAGTFLLLKSNRYLKKKVEVRQVTQIIQSLCVAEGVERDFFNPKAVRLAPLIATPGQHNTRLFPLLKSKGQSVNFIHIPKTAGTSIEKSFGFVPTGFFKSYDRSSRCHRFLGMAHLTPQQALSLGFDSRENYEQALTFAVVRNPYTRFLSDYHFMIETNSIKKETTVDELIDVFGKIVGAQATKGFIPSRLSDHATTQSQFIYFDDGERAVKEVLRFERLAEDWKRLTEKYPDFDWPSELPHENKSGQGKKKVRLSAEQKEKIYQIYQKDFENFGYAK